MERPLILNKILKSSLSTQTANHHRKKTISDQECYSQVELIIPSNDDSWGNKKSYGKNICKNIVLYFSKTVSCSKEEG